MNKLRVALAQINGCVGDFDGNRALVKKYYAEACGAGSSIVLFPELTICGYPPQDLVFNPDFVQENERALKNILPMIGETICVVGYVAQKNDRLFNSVAALQNSKIIARGDKTILPNYGVFDEKRTFKEGEPCPLLVINGIGVGVSICEDLWQPNKTIADHVEQGAGLLLNIAASPFSENKQPQRLQLLQESVQNHGCAVAMVNAVGGQDELVFDGGSCAYDKNGKKLAEAPRFEECLVTLDIPCAVIAAPKQKEAYVVTSPDNRSQKISPPPLVKPLSREEELYRALVLGTRDFVTKCGFGDACVAVSGGVDSALVATIAVDALGEDAVHLLYLPSRYSANQSRDLAFELTKNLGARITEIGIETAHTALRDALKPTLGAGVGGKVDENLQARLRAMVLFAFTVAKNAMPLTTGNKSEIATGYTTLYGDMAGMLAVIKDLKKTDVWNVARWRNSKGEPPIPEAIINRPPTAELKPNQLDQDVLPPYEELDTIIRDYIEHNNPKSKLTTPDQATTLTLKMLANSEYKRFQSPPGIKLTNRAFGRDRRIPIANRWHP